MDAEESERLASGLSASRRGRQGGGSSPNEEAAGHPLRVDVPALQAAEEWQRTFDAVPDLIAILDTQRRILRVNKAMADRLGLPQDQCVGQTCCTHVHGTDEPPSFCPHSRLLQDGEAHTVEVHEERIAGDALVSVSPLRDSTGRLIGSVHIARDITERKRVRRSLEASEAELSLIYENAPLVMLVVDSDRRVRRMNVPAVAMARRPGEECIELRGG